MPGRGVGRTTEAGPGPGLAGPAGFARKRWEGTTPEAPGGAGQWQGGGGWGMIRRCAAGKKLAASRPVSVDLNCDLAEDEPWSRTRALLRWVTSANVACGGHAGDVARMERCLREARRRQVRVGAHPGLPGAFGRGEVRLESAGLETLVLQQVGALARVAAVVGVRLRHVKLHGSLYHVVEQDPGLGLAYVHAVARWFPRLILYARAGGRVEKLARAAGLTVWPEAFADRGYRADGSLVARGEAGALLGSRWAVRERIQEHRRHGWVAAVDGARVPLRVRTWCVHGDTPEALALARTVRESLRT